MKRLTALLCFLGLACGLIAAGQDEFPAISHAELTAAMAAKKVTLIDVNGTSSYRNGRIPGAIDYATLRGDLAAALPKDKGALVVAYCGNEKCQAYRTAAKAVAALGYTNVKHYSPGIAGWRASGAAVEKGAP
ncbi:MAG: rhodanese-like domain-containing protein [Opitutaceae bacterium]